MPTDLLDEIKEYNSRLGPRCTTCRALSKMNPGLRGTVEAALLDDEIQGSALSKWLEVNHRIDVGPSSLNRHRRGSCRAC